VELPLQALDVAGVTHLAQGRLTQKFSQPSEFRAIPLKLIEQFVLGHQFNCW